MSWWRRALGYTAATYVQDVVVKPAMIAKVAREHADRVGKPLLNVGAGTPGSSLRVLLLGPTLWGDVNIDLAAPKRVPHGPDRVSYGDACDLREWADGHFGALIASHVLEHVDRPDVALSEFRRVADRVFVIVPTWWAPHTWLHPGHQWFIEPTLSKAFPIWTDREKVLLLPVSDNRRLAGCQTARPLPSPSSAAPPREPNQPSRSSPFASLPTVASPGTSRRR